MAVVNVNGAFERGRNGALGPGAGLVVTLLLNVGLGGVVGD